MLRALTLVVACALTATSCGEPEVVSTSSQGEPSPLHLRKISQTSGGFTGQLADFDQFGADVTAIGDLDANGTIDLAVGAPFNENDGTLVAPGAVWILFINADLTVESQVKIAPGVSGFDLDLRDGANFGAAVAGLGDVDGDGTGDLAIATPHFDIGDGNTIGGVWVTLLRTDGTVKAAHEIVPESFGGADDWWPKVHAFGSSLAAVGDVDGDGVRDVAVCARDWGGELPGEDTRTTRIVFLDGAGRATRVRELDQIPAGVDTISPAGDVDGNGVTDLAVSVGSLRHLALLDVNGSTKELMLVHDLYEPNLDFAGRLVEGTFAGVGDVDGDGIAELASLSTIRRRKHPPYDELERALVVHYLDRHGRFRKLRRVGENDAALYGRELAAVGDLDGDGRPEIAVPMPLDDEGGADRGAFWLLSISDVSGVTTTSIENVTTTTSTSTTTSLCEREDCGGDAGALWSVSFDLQESRPLGALEFTVDYSKAPGFFVGRFGEVACAKNPIFEAYAVFNDCDGGRYWGCNGPFMRAAMISSRGVVGPVSLASCEFRSEGPAPTPEDFAVTVFDVAQPNFRGAHARIGVSIAQATGD